MTAWRVSSLLILLSALSAPGAAAELRQITLRDGSVVIGEIDSLHNGTYSVRSPSLGTITVEDSAIERIEAPGPAAARPESKATPASAPSNVQIDDLQRRILADDAVKNSVTALMDDPQFQEVLQDPEIMAAIRAGNIPALERNAKVQSLLGNPKLQEISKKLVH